MHHESQLGSSSYSYRSAQRALFSCGFVKLGTQGELARELASEPALESVRESAAVEEMKLPERVSSSESSARSAQHTPERRPLIVCDSALVGIHGEVEGELAREPIGDATLEFVGEAVLREIRLLHRNAPAASSSSAFSCTHSGSIRDRKGRLRFRFLISPSESERRREAWGEQPGHESALGRVTHFGSSAFCSTMLEFR